MKRFLYLFALFVTMFAVKMVWAAGVSSIYHASVPVASQSTEDKNRVLPLALQQVLVKVSGKSEILNNPTIKVQLGHADALVQTFGYSPSTETARPYFAEVQFDAEGVNKILRDAAAPIWGMNRPLVIAWIEYEALGQLPQIIEGNTGSEVQLALKQAAEQRGLPILLPMMDVTDLSQMTVNDIATLNIPVLTNAAKRYNSDVILIARIVQQASGLSAQAKLVQGNDQWSWTISGKMLSHVLDTLMNHVADALAGQYARVVTNAVQGKVMLTVTGVAQQADFTQLLQYLQHLELVADVQVAQISGNNLTLKVSLRGTQQALTDLLLLGKKLTPVAGADNMLTYQWNP